MKIWKIHILTDKQLVAKLEQIRTEQRQINSKMMEQLARDNVLLSGAVKAIKRKDR